MLKVFVLVGHLIGQDGVHWLELGPTHTTIEDCRAQAYQHNFMPAPKGYLIAHYECRETEERGA